MSHKQQYEAWDSEADYGSTTFRNVERFEHSKRRQPSMGRGRKAPQSFNGIHRRRRRKITW